MKIGKYRRRVEIRIEDANESNELDTSENMENIDKDNDSFTTISSNKSAKLKNLTANEIKPVSTQNRYEGLEVENLPKPTPVIIKRVFNDHEELIKKLQAKAPNGFSLKFTKNSTNVFLNTLEDKEKLQKQLITDKICHYTFTEKSKKTHAFVVYGLDSKPDPLVISNELEQNYEISATKVYTMKNTRRPLYMVVTNNKITLDFLQKNVKSLLYTKIYWQRHQNKKQIIQCHNCQAWGHATANCFSKSKCLKCAADHNTKECTKSKESPAKCVNCGGNHPANSSNCEIYIRKIKTMGQANEIKEQYKPAPLPTNNPWEKRQYKQNHNNEEQFPPLPQPRTPLRPTRSMATSPASRSATPNPPPLPDENATNSLDEMSELFSQLETLNNHINISKFLIIIKNLNEQMAQCNNKQQKALVMLTFTQNLNSYDF